MTATTLLIRQQQWILATTKMMTLKMESNGNNYMKIINLLDQYNTKVQRVG
jgi:hypothetical protein